MLGVDLVDGDGADRLLGPKKTKRGKAASESNSDCKTADGEDLPAWQDQPAIPAMYADITGRSSDRRISRSSSRSSSGRRSSSR